MAGAYKVFNYKTIDLNEISFLSPNEVRTNVYLCATDTEYDILFQTRELELKSGIITDEKEAYLDVNIEGTDFQEFMVKLDEHNVQTSINNVKEWFNQELSSDAIRNYYKSNINEGILRMNVPFSRKKINVNVYDDKKNSISPSELSEGAKVVIVFRLNGLRYNSKKCIMDLDIIQVMLMKPKEKVVIPVENLNLTNRSTESRQDIAKKMELAHKIREKKQHVHNLYTELQTAELKVQELKNNFTQVAKELKDLEEEFGEDDRNEQGDEDE
jgi:hypothetical protein